MAEIDNSPPTANQSRHGDEALPQVAVVESQRDAQATDSAAPTEQAPSLPPGSQPKQGPVDWSVVGLIVGAVVIVVIIGLILYGMVSHPILTSVIRDIAIIVLALVTMITSIFLAILLFQLQSLIVLLRDEVQPMLESLNETAGTVRGTTTFVSDAVITPMIEVASFARGVGQILGSLSAIVGGKRNRRRTPSSNPQ